MQQENLTGQDVAGYQILNLVGEGGTSTVYRAQHPQFGVVAVKILKAKLRADKTAIARFVREAKYGTRVEHPNVVRTLEIGEAPGGLHFLATEWALGELLERYAKRTGPLDWVEVGVIVTQIADAVEAAHQAAIVHRDLKPENVMYDPESRTVKLLDFGIAMDTESGGDERLTRAGFFVGTLTYIAPEALSGERVSPQADQYSLATIAYFLLTGVLPYAAKSPREMFTKLLTEPPTPISVARKEITFPSEVEQVINRALSRDPAQRYPTSREFATAMVAALSIKPTVTPTTPNNEGTDSLWKSLWRFGK